MRLVVVLALGLYVVDGLGLFWLARRFAHAVRHPVAFEQADFFALQQRPQQILSPDLLALQELELRPGEQRHFKIAAGAEARHLGLIAAYRDLPNTRWRIRLDVQPGARNQFTLALDEHGISQRHTAGEP